MTRLPDWPERLADYVARHRGLVFGWGPRDCAHFAAGAVAAITAQDVLPCAWSSRDEAVRILRASGGLVAAVDAVLPRLAGPLLAQRGDVVMLRAPQSRRWLAVCDGAVAWAPGADCLVAVPMAQAVHAWGVGRCLPH